MNNDFAAVMAKKSDAQLIKIVTVERADYQQEALKAAEAEIARRNLDPNKVEELKTEAVNVSENEKTIDKAKVPLLLRFVTFVVDTIAWIVVMGILAFVLRLLEFERVIPAVAVNILVVFGTFFGYYFVMEHYYQKTIGKFLTKTRVVDIQGNKPELNAILVRTVLRFLGGIDGVSFFFMKDGIHDHLSKTRVINDRP